MEDLKLGIPTYEEKHQLIAFQHLLKVLVPNQNLPDDFREILVNLDSRLSSMVDITENNEREIRDMEKRFRLAEEKIKKWDLNQTMISDSCPVEAAEYLNSVVEIHRLVESLRVSSVNGSSRQNKLLLEADCVLQKAMSRLETELIHILGQHKQHVRPNLPDEPSSSIDFTERSDDYAIKLIHPHVIPHLKSIADIMFTLDYDREFCQAFVRSRTEALDEYLIVLEIQKYSIEDLMKMDCIAFNNFIKKWIRATKIIVQNYLVSEKKLCNQIFERFETVNSLCFIEISKFPILRLLNYGLAITMGPCEPEKLFHLLDMYGVLAELLIDIDLLFSDDKAAFITFEFQELFLGLSYSTKSTFIRFRNAVLSSTSTGPLLGGRIHPLTKYVMNYIRTLTIYSNSLNVLLKEEDKNDLQSGIEQCSSTDCPTASQLKLIASHLISNLDKESELYRDGALKSIFLMNNIHYMVQKVKDSDLGHFFGNEWIRIHKVKFQKHAMVYGRVTWGPLFSQLMVDCSSGKKIKSKKVFKERCRGFTNLFEEIYKRQTGWYIEDHQLRDELQISTSQKLIHAYQTWLSKNEQYDLEKHAKYTSDDLGKYIFDFFEAKQKSLHNLHKR